MIMKILVFRRWNIAAGGITGGVVGVMARAGVFRHITMGWVLLTDWTCQMHLTDGILTPRRWMGTIHDIKKV